MLLWSQSVSAPAKGKQEGFHTGRGRVVADVHTVPGCLVAFWMSISGGVSRRLKMMRWCICQSHAWCVTASAGKCPLRPCQNGSPETCWNKERHVLGTALRNTLGGGGKERRTCWGVLHICFCVTDFKCVPSIPFQAKPGPFCAAHTQNLKVLICPVSDGFGTSHVFFLKAPAFSQAGSGSYSHVLEQLLSAQFTDAGITRVKMAKPMHYELSNMQRGVDRRASGTTFQGFISHTV